MAIKKKLKIDITSYTAIERDVDYRLFSDRTFEIIDGLYNSKDDLQAMTGWINLPHTDDVFKKVNDFSKKILAEDKYDHLLVIGIGGSSLGPQALLEAVNSNLWNRMSKGKRKGGLTVDFIDNLDPHIVRNILSRLKLDKTLFLVVSKGGGTLETIVPMLIAKEWTGKDFYNQCVFVTTEGKGLLSEIAAKNNVPVFGIPENVGGRFSNFSPVGLLPAALCGLDLEEIQAGLKDADETCKLKDVRQNLAAMIAMSSYFSYKKGKNIFVLMPYSTCLRKFVDWFVQLWAESLGKKGLGSTPIPAIGATDQHSQIQLFNEGPNDKLICFVKINKHKRDLTIPDFSSENDAFSIYSGKKVGKILNMELDATRKALTERRKANFLITLPELNEYYLSYFMYILEMSTAIAGGLLGINPFDQPGVELAKKYTKENLVNS